MSGPPLPPTALPAPTSKQVSSFEFTKRKRWRDLLSAELADGFVLILSAAGRVLYCGSAVSEILGWSNHELVDGDLLEFILPTERANFRRQFENCIRSDAEFLCFVYLRCKDSVPTNSGDKTSTNWQSVLFELMGQRLPLAGPDQPTVCFVMAKPYPGRNTDTLNTFLTLMIDNERLQQRLAKLKMQSSTVPFSNPGLPVHHQYAASSSSQQLSDVSNPQFPSSATLDWGNRPSRVVYDTSVNTSSFAYETRIQALSEDDASDEGSRKKKARRSSPLEQYVCITCGRTDSPEWRKGPLGPKTLCNACGLRWAKQMRRTDETAEPPS